jgi:hypothetical protein
MTLCRVVKPPFVAGGAMHRGLPDQVTGDPHVWVSAILSGSGLSQYHPSRPKASFVRMSAYTLT